MTSSIGDRMKRYEAVYDHKLVPRSPLFIRVDGRAFHTFLRHAEKPFDQRFIDAMVETARDVAKQMQGFKLAYVQSDECTFCLTDTDDLATQGWFDYNLNKVVSLSAAMFSVFFGKYYESSRSPIFDSRAFTVPADDAPNNFVWRQRDWERNSVQMLARAHFSHKQCHGKKIPDLHELLHTKDINWAVDISDQQRNGTFITRSGDDIHDKLTYEDINTLIHMTKKEVVNDG